MKLENKFTVCPYCGTGCGFYLQVLDGALVGIRPVRSHPISQGKLCIKGWQAHEFVNSAERLRKPLIKKNGKLQEASWSEALALTAKKLVAAGPEHVACLSSAKVTNEENYLMQKFTRVVLKTNSVDHCARL